IAAREACPTRVTAAVVLDWSRILAILRPTDQHLAKWRVDVAMASEACRGDAVELIDAALDACEQVLGLADAKQVPRPCGWDIRQRPVQDGVHVSLRLAERAADGHPVER